MTRIGNHQQFEVFARVDKRLRNLHRRRRIDILIQPTDAQHQRAIQFRRIDKIRVQRVTRIDRPTHPLFVPPNLVHAIVVTTAIRRRN